ncbi:unnamed protein product [Closterium sp. Yama58-4]|nr:unnamed protein product [Closterium sp. Yama58-4]
MDTSVSPDSAPVPVARLPAARRYLRRIRPADKQQQQQEQQRGRISAQPAPAADANPSPFAAPAAAESSQSQLFTPSRFSLFSSAVASRKVAPVITFESITADSSTVTANPFAPPHGSVFPSLARPAFQADGSAPIFTAGTAAASRGEDDVRLATPPTPATSSLANSSATCDATPAHDTSDRGDVAGDCELSLSIATGSSSLGEARCERSSEAGVAESAGGGRCAEAEGRETIGERGNCERSGESRTGQGIGETDGREGTFGEGSSGEGRFGVGRFGEDVTCETRSDESGARVGDGVCEGVHTAEDVGRGGAQEERHEGREGREGHEGQVGGKQQEGQYGREQDEEACVGKDAITDNSVDDGEDRGEESEGSEESEESEEGDEGEEDDTGSESSSAPPRAPSPSPPPNLNPLALLALSHAPFPSASSVTSTTATTFSGGTSPTLSSAAAASSRSAVSPPTSPSAPSAFPPFSFALAQAAHPIPHPRPPSSAVVNMASLTASQKFAKLLQQLAKQSAELTELRGELADAKAEVAEMQAVLAKAGLDFVRERMEKERLGQACAKLNNALLSSRRETADERERRELAERLAVAAELARRQLLEEITLERAQLARADNWREHNVHLKLVEAQMVVSEKVAILEVLHAELEKKFRQVGAGRLWRGEEERPFGWFLRFLKQPEGKAWALEGLGGGGEEAGGAGEKGKGKAEEAADGGDGATPGASSSNGAASNEGDAQEGERRGDSNSARDSTESDSDEYDNDRTGGSSDSLSESIPLVGGGGDELRIPKLRDRSGNAGGSSSNSARIPGRGGGSRCRWRGDRLLDAGEPMWQGGYHGCSACGHGRPSAVAAAAANMCGLFSSCSGRGVGNTRSSGVGSTGNSSVGSLSVDGWLGLSALASVCSSEWFATAAAVTVESVNSVCGGERVAAGAGAERREGNLLGMRLPFSSCFDTQYTLSATHDDLNDDDAGAASSGNGRAAEARRCGCMHRSRLGPRQGNRSGALSMGTNDGGIEERSGEQRGKAKASALLPPKPQRAGRGAESGSGGGRGCGGGEYCQCCGRCCRCPIGNRGH